MLSEEEKKAIEQLKNDMILSKNEEGFDFEVYCDNRDLDTVLNLVEKLEKENIEIKKRKDDQEKRFKRYKENIDKQHEEIYENLESEKIKYICLYQKALDNTVKSDKENMHLKRQIDLMANNLIGIIFSDKENIEMIFDNKEKVKQYFEKLAKEKGE